MVSADDGHFFERKFLVDNIVTSNHNILSPNYLVSISFDFINWPFDLVVMTMHDILVSLNFVPMSFYQMLVTIDVVLTS